jgi:hypothetical protein
MSDESESPYGMVYPQDEPEWADVNKSIPAAGKYRRRGGMDLLEYYTGKALVGILAGYTRPASSTTLDLDPSDEVNVGRQAVRLALSTLAALERERHGK